MGPYNATMKWRRQKMKDYRDSLGLKRITGVGKIKYWNKFFKEVEPAAALKDGFLPWLYPVKEATLSAENGFVTPKLYDYPGYDEYKAAMKQRRAQSMAAYNKLSPTEKEAYAREKKLYATAKKDMAAYMKSLRQQAKTVEDLTMGQIALPPGAEEFKAKLAAAKGRLGADYANIDVDRLSGLYGDRNAKALASYTSTLENFADRPAYVTPTYGPASLTGRLVAPEDMQQNN